MKTPYLCKEDKKIDKKPFFVMKVLTKGNISGTNMAEPFRFKKNVLPKNRSRT